MHGPIVPLQGLRHATLAAMNNVLPPLPSFPTGRYRHYKGLDYQVLGLVRHSETLEPLVLYQALYGERGLWVRPLAMFQETVRVDGKVLLRFAPVMDHGGATGAAGAG